MVSFGQLLLPVVLSAVILFIASSIIWMMGPHHKKEWSPLPNYAAVREALRAAGISEGGYVFPHMTNAERKDKAVVEQKMKDWAEGPAGVLYIAPKGRMNMGKMMGLQFGFFLLASALLAIVDCRLLATGTPYIHVFKVTSTVGFMMFAIGSMPESIWFARPWKSWFLQAIDGAIYAMLAAGTFGWLWPR